MYIKMHYNILQTIYANYRNLEQSAMFEHSKQMKLKKINK